MADVPDKALADFLETDIAELTKGTNLFRGPVRAAVGVIPSRAVFVLSTGGLDPEAFNGELNTIQRPSIQIRIRGDREGFEDGQDLARRIRSSAHYATLTDYIDVRVADGDPNYLGQDDDGHPEWSVNVSLVVEGEV